VQDKVRYSGVIEFPGLPTRPKLKNTARIRPEDASATPTPDQQGRQQSFGARFDSDRAFALAAASLRQALQDMPELTELSKHLVVEESKDGLNIEIVDQNGRSMFPEGSRHPFERTRRLIHQLAIPLKAMPFRLSITGHTSASRLPSTPGYGPWELSSDRANSVRQLLEIEGLPSSRFYMIAGQADSQPLFPDDPYIAANRRVTITLMREAPPIPAGARP
jgi:chemotaxis protein MotB